MTRQRNRNRELLIDLIRPFVRLLAFGVGTLYQAMFGWWVGPWLQRRANQSLVTDVEKNLLFLFQKGHVVEESRIRILPFDYASVEIAWENLLLCFTRGREELNVVVAPSHAPNLTYELGPLIAALENRNLSDHDAIIGLSDAANLLRPRLDTLSEAFSEQEFPRTRERLWK